MDTVALSKIAAWNSCSDLPQLMIEPFLLSIDVVCDLVQLQP